jgi:integrase
MVGAGLSAKSINNYIQVLKMVVASAVDEDGDELYPRRWNHDFAEVPLIEVQHTPEFTGEEVSAVVANAFGRYRVLYALLGGSGLRIGEALGLRIENISEDRTSIEIEEQVQQHQLQPTKTRASVRVVDLHHELAKMLDGFIGDRKAGFLICTSSGRPMSDDNVYRRFYPLLRRLGIEQKGFHAFRRFRNTHLSEKEVPDRLIQFWMGHKDRTMTDRYTKLRRVVSFRKAWAEKVGLGFELPAPASVVVDNDGLGAYVAPNAPKIDTLELAVVA